MPLPEKLQHYQPIDIGQRKRLRLNEAEADLIFYQRVGAGLMDLPNEHEDGGRASYTDDTSEAREALEEAGFSEEAPPEGWLSKESEPKRRFDPSVSLRFRGEEVFRIPSRKRHA